MAETKYDERIADQALHIAETLQQTHRMSDDQVAVLHVQLIDFAQLVKNAAISTCLGHVKDAFGKMVARDKA